MGRLAFAASLMFLGIAPQSVSGQAAETQADRTLAHSQSGSEAVNSSICHTGNSTTGSCGGGSPAGITYVTTAHDWSQKTASRLTGGTQATVTLTPCPAGIDTTSGVGYQVFISDERHNEAVDVISGSCQSGESSGTITFTPYYSYSARSTIGSASSGIQETLNDACGVDPTAWKNSQCNVILPANGPGYPAHSVNTYSVPGTIYLHSNQSVLSGYGASLDCTGRAACLQVGNLTSSNAFTNNTIHGLSFRSPVNYSNNPAYAGVAIAKTQRSSQLVTIATASPHGFRAGDMVTILFTDNSAYWGDAMVTAVPSSTTFQYAHSGSDIASQATPGVVALAYVAILDNGMNTHLTDIAYDKVGDKGNFNNFFDLWDDESATIEHFNNNAISLNHGANWTGSFVFSAGNQGRNQIAPVITLRDSTITANGSNGVTVYNCNGLYVENTVLQATGPWQVYASNSTGNYQGAYLKNIYSESSAAANPVSPAHSPFAGTGVSGLIAGPTSAAGTFAIAGVGGVQGWFASGGSGSTHYSYFIVANDTTAGSHTSPMQVLNYNSTGSDSIPVRWPRVANAADTITYDVIRTTTPGGTGAAYPSHGNCNGGTATACGYVAHNLPQCAGLVCNYTDSGSVVSQPYTIPPGTYAGNLIFWPGSIVSVNQSVAVDIEHPNVVGVGLNNSPLQVANRCTDYGQTSPGGYTACAASVTTANNSVPNQTATLMTDGGSAGGGQTVSKGRLNFGTSPWAALQPHHIITLVDSQPGLTRGTIGYRPPASASDVWIGTDVPMSGVNLNLGQLAFGAPVSITHYIDATGDGGHSNWLERLTLKQKTFAVPVKITEGNSFSLGGGTPLTQIKVYSVTIPASHVPAQSCIDVVGKVAGLTKSDQITGITPPQEFGNLSLNAYAAGADAILFHFCNPSGAEAIAPPGTYSFLAMR